MKVVDSPLYPVLDVKGLGSAEDGSYAVVELVTPDGIAAIQLSVDVAQKLILATQQAIALVDNIKGAEESNQPARGVGDHRYEATMFRFLLSPDGQTAILNCSGPQGPPLNIEFDARVLSKIQSESKNASQKASRLRQRRVN